MVATTVYDSVVPLEGTWIEIKLNGGDHGLRQVVPLEGTWIEITTSERK